MLRLTIIGHGGGHAGAVGTGRHGDIAAGGSTKRTRIGPALHSVPDAVTVFLLQLYLDRAMRAGIFGCDITGYVRGAAADRQRGGNA